MPELKNYKKLQLNRSGFCRAIGFVVSFLITIQLNVSCGRSAWTSEQEKIFMDECSAEGGSSSYCKCYLEKVIEKYPNYADSKNLDFESAVEMAKSCE